MPNYYNNPYMSYTTPTAMSYGTTPYNSSPAPQYAQPQYAQQVNPTMIWVDGEAAARAYQIPPTHPVGQPIALWDNNDMVIYLKSVDSFGRPAPLKKIRYTVEQDQQSFLPSPMDQSGQSGAAQEQNVDTSKFVTKDDLESLKNELKNVIQQSHSQNQNGNQNRSNNERGGKQ